MPLSCSVEDGIFVVRTSGVVKMADVEKLALEEDLYLAEPGCPALFLVDNTELKVISPDGADAIVERMRLGNARITRSAFVVAEGTSALQLARMVRESGSEKRRTFTSEAEARRWLRA
jgi:hypothetical protein